MERWKGNVHDLVKPKFSIPGWNAFVITSKQLKALTELVNRLTNFSSDFHVMHGDLTLRNILYRYPNPNNKDDIQYALSDFGLATAWGGTIDKDIFIYNMKAKMDDFDRVYWNYYVSFSIPLSVC